MVADTPVRLLVVLGSVTPPGRLRQALLDAVVRNERDGELEVELAAMGASDSHFLGADRHLRDVLSFFGALVLPVSVYLTGADFPEGVPAERAAQALDELIAGTRSLTVALSDQGQLGPSPLAARAIRR
jgi:hypothetical protein